MSLSAPPRLLCAQCRLRLIPRSALSLHTMTSPSPLPRPRHPLFRPPTQSSTRAYASLRKPSPMPVEGPARGEEGWMEHQVHPLHGFYKREFYSLSLLFH